MRNEIDIISPAKKISPFLHEEKNRNWWLTGMFYRFDKLTGFAIRDGVNEAHKSGRAILPRCQLNIDIVSC